MAANPLSVAPTSSSFNTNTLSGRNEGQSVTNSLSSKAQSLSFWSTNLFGQPSKRSTSSLFDSASNVSAAGQSSSESDSAPKTLFYDSQTSQNAAETASHQLNVLNMLVRDLTNRVAALEGKNLLLTSEMAALKAALLGPQAPVSALDALHERNGSTDSFNLSFSTHEGLRSIAMPFMSPPAMPLYDTAFAPRSPASSRRPSSVYSSSLTDHIGPSPVSSYVSNPDVTEPTPISTLFTPTRKGPVDYSYMVESSPSVHYAHRKKSKTALTLAPDQLFGGETQSQLLQGDSLALSDNGKLGAINEDDLRTPTIPSMRDLILAGQLSYDRFLDLSLEIDEQAVVDRLLAIADQSLSIHMQARVSSAIQGPVVDRMCDAIGKKLVELCKDRFGNFLVSCCLQFASVTTVKDWIATCETHIMELAFDQYGCHVLQKLLDVGGDEARDLVFEEMCSDVMSMTNKFAAHVWIRLFKRGFPVPMFNIVSKKGAKKWHEIAMTETGSTLVQRMLAARPEVPDIRQDCLDHLNKLVCSSFGHSAILSMTQGGPNAITSKIIKHATTFATNEYGVKVVERVMKLTHVTATQRKQFVEFLCTEKNGQSSLVNVVSSGNSGYELVHYLLTTKSAATVDPKDREKLIKAVKRNQSALSRSHHGQRIVQTANSK